MDCFRIKMLRSLIAGFMVVSALYSFAQNLVVSQCKNAFYRNGQAIEVNDSIPRNSIVHVGKRGSLTIRHRGHWSMHFKMGLHNIDSAWAIETARKEFLKHDSIWSVLNKRGLDECNFSYRCEEILDGAVHGQRRTDDIKLSMEEHVIAGSDSVKIAWTYPISYSGEYYIVVMNLFEQYIGLTTTKSSEIEMNMRPFKTEKAVLLKVISEDCRESYAKLLQLK